MKIVYGITGMPCAGKTTLQKALIKTALQHNIIAAGTSMSQILRDFHKWLTNIQLEGSLLEIGCEYRRYWGQGWLAHLAALKAEHYFNGIAKPFKNKIYVVEGLRGNHEYQVLADHFDGYWRYGGNFFLVYIHAPLTVRFKRSRERGRPDDAETYEEFKRRDENEFEKLSLIGKRFADAKLLSGSPVAHSHYLLWRVGLIEQRI